VRLDGADAERETEREMLTPLPPGLPDLLPMVRLPLTLSLSLSLTLTLTLPLTLTLTLT